MNILPTKCLIMKRFMSFFISGINHNCTLIAIFFKNTILSKSTHMSTNINTVLKYLDVKLWDILDLNKIKIKQAFICKSEEPDWRSSYVKELLHVKEENMFIDLELD